MTNHSYEERDDFLEHHSYEETPDKFYSNVYPPTGWICPVCGCGIAPNVHQCSCQLKVQSY